MDLWIWNAGQERIVDRGCEISSEVGFPLTYNSKLSMSVEAEWVLGVSSG